MPRGPDPSERQIPKVDVTVYVVPLVNVPVAVVKVVVPVTGLVPVVKVE